MRLLLAIFLPFLVFFTIGRPLAGIVCLILQFTLIGWIPAALWAVYALSEYNTDRKIDDELPPKWIERKLTRGPAASWPPPVVGIDQDFQ